MLCVSFESRHFPEKRFTLPVLARLYLNKSSAQKWKRTYRKKTDLMLDMLRLLERHVKQQAAETGLKRLHFIGDSAFTAPSVLKEIPKSITVTGRVVDNVRMNEPAPLPTGKPGRPHVRGSQLPKPKELLQAKGLKRQKLSLYEGSKYHVRLAEQSGRFYKAPDRPVKVVVVEHLKGGRGVEVFYTTIDEDACGNDVSAEEVLKTFSYRWPIEVTFHDVKQHLGIEEPQNRVTKAVRRTAPTGLLLYSLIVWWHETACEKPAEILRPWSHKHGPSFAEMLASLRLKTLETAVKPNCSTPGHSPGVNQLLKTLKYLLALAA